MLVVRRRKMSIQVSNTSVTSSQEDSVTPECSGPSTTTYSNIEQVSRLHVSGNSTSHSNNTAAILNNKASETQRAKLGMSKQEVEVIGASCFQITEKLGEKVSVSCTKYIVWVKFRLSPHGDGIDDYDGSNCTVAEHWNGLQSVC